MQADEINAMVKSTYDFELRSRLLFQGGEIVFGFAKPKPNAWYRFWTRLLMGWIWEDA